MMDADRQEGLREELARAERLLAVAIEGGPSTVAPEQCPHPGLRRLARCFALAPLERDIVLLAIAVELSPRFASLYDRLTGRKDGRPTVSAIAATLGGRDRAPDAVTAALAPGEQLVRHGLIELEGDGPFPSRIVRMPDRMWPRVVDLAATTAFPVVPHEMTSLPQAVLAPSTRADVELAVARAARGLGFALIVVTGSPDAAPEPLAAAIAGALRLPSLLVPASALDDDAQRRDAVREANWLQAAVVVQGVPSSSALSRLATEIGTPILVVAETTPSLSACTAAGRWRLDISVDELPHELRLECWRRHLDGVPLASDVDLARYAAQYRCGVGRIAMMATAARERAQTRGTPLTLDDLRGAARRGAARMSGLAQRFDGDHRLHDVVVPAATRRELELACTWARHAFAAMRGDTAGPSLRDRVGLVALFYGLPGTGKTLAARAIAGELGVDLLRIDLSQVVNKYIGETEKNLERVFVEAETSGAILFFDEADALFGKRSEVKDAHDRYANIETAFLLQRLEGHRGVCILATNLRQNLDEAFSRRIQIAAEFPSPTADARREIWERHLRVDRFAADVDLPALAKRFAISGGDIANAAATAVVLAAADGGAVEMRHLVSGVWREVKKSGRLVNPDDLGPWRSMVADLERR